MVENIFDFEAVYYQPLIFITAQKMKFSVKDFFRK